MANSRARRCATLSGSALAPHGSPVLGSVSRSSTQSSTSDVQYADRSPPPEAATTTSGRVLVVPPASGWRSCQALNASLIERVWTLTPERLSWRTSW